MSGSFPSSKCTGLRVHDLHDDSCHSDTQEHPDTDPEDDGGNTEGGLQTRRSSRQSKKPKTFAEEFIAELDPESHMGIPGGSPGRGEFLLWVSPSAVTETVSAGVILGQCID